MKLPKLTTHEEIEAIRSARRLGYSLGYVRNFMRRDKANRVLQESTIAARTGTRTTRTASAEQV